MQINSTLKLLLIHTTYSAFQRSHFVFGNAAALWKSFLVLELDMYFGNNTLTHSLVDQEMYSPRIQEEPLKFGWAITKNIIMLLYLWPEMFHLESKYIIEIILKSIIKFHIFLIKKLKNFIDSVLLPLCSLTATR